MNNSLIKVIPFLLFFPGCQHKAVTESVIVPKALVETISFKSGFLTEDINFQAQSVYMVKNAVTSPISGYVSKSFFMQGDRVNTGEILYELITKERKAIGESLPGDTVYKNMGIIRIKSNNSGIVSSMEVFSGDYVTEGTPMCQIGDVKSLVFKLQVPFEQSNLVKPGLECSINLPDGKTIQGVVKKELGQMSLYGQTRQFLVTPSVTMFIPENLLATVHVLITKTESHQILPVSAVLSDEMMQNFWIMKMINDTTAVKVKVKTGLRNKDEIEIAEPVFSSGDRILSSGHYGLPDTAFVNTVSR